jgi:ribosomal-protein-alanine N-acetyltransferase
MTRETSMAFFRTVSSNETVPTITGAGVTLRPPHTGDFTEWAILRETSRSFLVPWEPTWPSDDLTRGAFRRRLKRYAEDQRSDLAYAFLIFRSDDNAMVGGLTIANIRRGVAQAGSVGYWIGAPFARKGYMTAAVRALIPYSFSALRLHRLEAACIPDNAASIRLLEKTGFTREGYARSYLCINGVWQDHLLYARLKNGAD